MSEMAKMREMAKMLVSHGESFSGLDPFAIAEDWVDHGFGVWDADEWCDVGVWDAASAAAFRDAGLTPGQVAETARRLNGQGDRDIDVVYAICNGDMDASVMIEAAK
jgi:hypothetical protein